MVIVVIVVAEVEVVMIILVIKRGECVHFLLFLPFKGDVRLVEEVEKKEMIILKRFPF